MYYKVSITLSIDKDCNWSLKNIGKYAIDNSVYANSRNINNVIFI